MTEKEKEDLVAGLVTKLEGSLYTTLRDFWDRADVDSATTPLSEKDCQSIDAAAIQLFSLGVLASAGRTREEWMQFCGEIFDQMDFEDTPLNTTKVGEA